MGSKIDQNHELSVRSIFKSNSKILKDYSNNVFVLLDYLWSKFNQDQTIIGGIRDKKTIRSHFMDAESIQGTLKIFKNTDGTYHKYIS